MTNLHDCRLGVGWGGCWERDGVGRGWGGGVTGMSEILYNEVEKRGKEKGEREGEGKSNWASSSPSRRKRRLLVNALLWLKEQLSSLMPFIPTEQHTGGCNSAAWQLGWDLLDLLFKIVNVFQMVWLGILVSYGGSSDTCQFICNRTLWERGQVWETKLGLLYLCVAKIQLFLHGACEHLGAPWDAPPAWFSWRCCVPSLRETVATPRGRWSWWFWRSKWKHQV